MYIIVKYDLLTKRREVLTETISPKQAYELAHELDAAARFGRDEIGLEFNKDANPCTVVIEDEYGNDVWQECAKARCPSVGMLQ